ncbi:hypothetical protein HBH61_216220 [Parastagonospora nodorum]|nr:hypothetical protein HBH46_201960 [Parastagonospora nodorum]KAH4800212.1 hypothetical protein HBH61_216220 [Parastagonospora nodorum]KAH6201561.1 hypothetical protein HBI15_185890 [Parastagonospora nodorum]
MLRPRGAAPSKSLEPWKLKGGRTHVRGRVCLRVDMWMSSLEAFDAGNMTEERAGSAHLQYAGTTGLWALVGPDADAYPHASRDIHVNVEVSLRCACLL